MQTQDVSKFTMLMAGIGELYGKTISSQLIDIYWQVLRKYDLIDVQNAFQSHVKNPDCGQFFPKPADIIRFIEGNGESKALMAWAKAERAMIQIGRYQSVVFDDPLIHSVIEDMGGWVKFCAMKNEQMPFVANEFQKRYMGYVIKNPERHPKYLWGISECDNTKNGFLVEPPILIGDPEKAKEVLKLGGGTALLTEPLEKSLSKVILKISSSKFVKPDDKD